ncbi:MAG TPA: AraC family transcriptional regulator [Terriglobia bacterium]|nr:AraC family transcriptional regulator [Terriglobia bacterium]
MDSRLSRIIELLTSNPAERRRLPQLAKQSGVSIRTLELLFKKDTGKPFSAFYRELRITLAKKMLAGTQWPVKVIASRLGYKSVEVFCRDFKRVSGATPLEFRSRRRKASLQKKSIECR